MKFQSEERICKNCSVKFEAIRRHQLYCSDRCRLDFWRKKNSDPQKISEIEHRLRIVEEKLGIS
jgi:hypothetical protein